jgi:hypothetical protein
MIKNEQTQFLLLFSVCLQLKITINTQVLKHALALAQLIY